MLSANASGGIGTKFAVQPHDHLYAVDSHGITCSQVMHVVLRRVTRRIQNDKGSQAFQGVVHLPYATEKFEPVDAYSETQLVPTSAYDADGFRNAFAVRRSPVFGEEEFEAFMGDGYRSSGDELFRMTEEFFAEHLYAPAPVAGRRVYFCFNESVHVVLKRLVMSARMLEAGVKVDKVSQQLEQKKGRPIAHPEVGQHTVDACKDASRLHRSPLEGVVVVAVPFGDDAAEPTPGTEPYSAAAFKQAYQKYEHILDVPNSAEILESKQFEAHNKPYYRR